MLDTESLERIGTIHIDEYLTSKAEVSLLGDFFIRKEHFLILLELNTENKNVATLVFLNLKSMQIQAKSEFIIGVDDTSFVYQLSKLDTKCFLSFEKIYIFDNYEWDNNSINIKSVLLTTSAPPQTFVSCFDLGGDESICSVFNQLYGDIKILRNIIYEICVTSQFAYENGVWLYIKFGKKFSSYSIFNGTTTFIDAPISTLELALDFNSGQINFKDVACVNKYLLDTNSFLVISDVNAESKNTNINGEVICEIPYINWFSGFCKLFLNTSHILQYAPSRDTISIFKIMCSNKRKMVDDYSDVENEPGTTFKLIYRQNFCRDNWWNFYTLDDNLFFVNLCLLDNSIRIFKIKTIDTTPQ